MYIACNWGSSAGWVPSHGIIGTCTHLWRILERTYLVLSWKKIRNETLLSSLSLACTVDRWRICRGGSPCPTRSGLHVYDHPCTHTGSDSPLSCIHRLRPNNHPPSTLPAGITHKKRFKSRPVWYYMVVHSQGSCGSYMYMFVYTRVYTCTCAYISWHNSSVMQRYSATWSEHGGVSVSR